MREDVDCYTFALIYKKSNLVNGRRLLPRIFIIIIIIISDLL